METTVYSSLSDEEIAENFQKIDDAACVKASLEQIRAYKNGDKTALRVRERILPSIDVAHERKKMNLTQKAFARILGVSKRTVEAWETGRSNPSPTAINLMFLLSKDPSLVTELEAHGVPIPM